MPSEALSRLTNERNRSQLVLIVEDEVLIRIEMARLLEEEGLRVLEAASPGEAIEVLVAGAEKIDLVLSDVCMPREADGLKFVEWLKENRPSIPVVLCTSLTSLVPFGGPVIRKPYDPEKLVRQVQSSLDRCRAEADQTTLDPFGTGMPPDASSADRARMYRNKASEILSVAEGALDAEARASLFGIAESYLQMAITLETVERFQH